MLGSEGNSKCGACKLDLPNDVSDYCLCRLCRFGYHFGDCSIKCNSWRGLGKAKQAEWLCQSCRTKNRSGSQSQSEEDVATLDISTKLDRLMGLIPSVNKVKEAIEFLSEKYDTIIQELRLVRQENKDLKNELGDVKKRLVSSEDAVKTLEGRLNELEQYGRRVNLEIHGVSVRGPRLEEEETERVVEDLAKDIGITYVPNEIHKLHRLQRRSDGKPPAILVQFMSTVRRDAWLQAGKRARLSERVTGSKIFFNENLTHFYRGLLKETKTRARIHGYRFVWFSNGKVLAKKKAEDKNVVIVKSYNDINKIV